MYEKNYISGIGNLIVNGGGNTRILVGEVGIDLLTIGGNNTTSFSAGTYNY